MCDILQVFCGLMMALCLIGGMIALSSYGDKRQIESEIYRVHQAEAFDIFDVCVLKETKKIKTTSPSFAERLIYIKAKCKHNAQQTIKNKYMEKGE